jgi:hypothetical protein
MIDFGYIDVVVVFVLGDWVHTPSYRRQSRRGGVGHHDGGVRIQRCRRRVILMYESKRLEMGRPVVFHPSLKVPTQV